MAKFCPTWLKKWQRQLLFALALFLFPAAALIYRGHDAFRGITWGYRSTLRALLSTPVVYRLSGEKTGNLYHIDPNALTVNFGIYDPDRTFEHSEAPAIEHYFISWISYQAETLQTDLKYATAHNRWPLLTIEPWPHQATETGRQNLFDAIQSGEYDTVIADICTTIAEFEKPLFVRWGHEMEHVTGRYPWAQEDAAGYIAAYQYFVDHCRSRTNNIYYVWSPVGNKELVNYWPGPEYADYIGLSVYSFPTWELDHYGKIRSFDEILWEKYERIKKFDRPVMIAEFGATGSRGEQWLWLYEASQSFANYPLLKTVVFFNAADSPLAWGPDYTIPDWHLSPEIFN